MMSTRLSCPNCLAAALRFCVSEPVPPMNSDTSGVKCEGLLMTSGGDAEVLRTLASAYVLHPCDTCILVFRRTKRQRDGGPMKVRVARRQRRQRRTEGSSQEVFKMIFELRDNPLSVQSTYTLHWICIVTEKRRRDTVET